MFPLVQLMEWPFQKLLQISNLWVLGLKYEFKKGGKVEWECVISSGILFPALSFDLCSSVVQTICRNIAKPSYFVIFYFSHLSAYAIKILVFSLDLYQRLLFLFDVSLLIWHLGLVSHLII